MIFLYCLTEIRSAVISTGMYTHRARLHLFLLLGAVLSVLCAVLRMITDPFMVHSSCTAASRIHENAVSLPRLLIQQRISGGPSVVLLVHTARSSRTVQAIAQPGVAQGYRSMEEIQRFGQQSKHRDMSAHSLDELLGSDLMAQQI